MFRQDNLNIAEYSKLLWKEVCGRFYSVGKFWWIYKCVMFCVPSSTCSCSVNSIDTFLYTCNTLI